MKLQWVCLIILCILPSGCAKGMVASRYMIQSPGQPTNAPVQVFMLGQPIPPWFREVAILQAVRFEDESPRLVMAKITTDAQALGCDTLVKVHIQTGQRWALYGHSMWTSATGICGQVWRGPAPQSPPSPPVPAPQPQLQPPAPEGRPGVAASPEQLVE